MKKNAFRLFFLFLVLVFSVLSLNYINKNIFRIWNATSVKVAASPALDRSKIKVEFGSFTINRKDDSELFTAKSVLLYDRGRAIKRPETDHGENDFLVTYDNRYYLSFRHFITNCNRQHNYYFYLYEEGGDVRLKVRIAGKDKMFFERPMQKISRAKEYRCNTPIENAGYLYNMVELEKR